VLVAGARAEQRFEGDGSDRGRRPGRGLLLLALALVLVAFVGLGSRAPLWDIGGPPRLADPDSYSGDLVVVAFALLVVMPWIITAARRRRRVFRNPGRDLPRMRMNWRQRALALLAFLLALGLSLLILSALPGAGKRPKGPPGKLVPSPPGAARGAGRTGMPVHWWGYGMLAVVLIGGVAAVWYLRSPPARAPLEPEEPDELLAAVDLSLEDLERDPDPRRAVIRAYARMERALESYGLARRTSETPLEYLARALTSLRVGRRSVERLTVLFERAKFSQHDIDVAMKGEAIAALGALRDELAGAAA